MTWLGVGVASLGLWCGTGERAYAQECQAPRPEWIFCHDFEAPDSDDFGRYWDDIYGAGNRMFLRSENPRGIAGGHSLRLQIANDDEEPLAQGVTAGPKKFLGREVDWEVIYYRRYMRFGADFHQGNFMHLGGLSATHPSRYPWGCMGGAGRRPRGDQCFSSNLEPWSDYGRHPWPGAWGFYSYYYRMYMDCGHPGPDDCYGDMFAPARPDLISRGEWHDFEMSIDPGTPGLADGSQTFWIDGRKVYTASGIPWRTAADLRVNQAGLYLYIHHNPGRTTNTLDVDNVVLARSYIGPAACLESVPIGAPCLCGGIPDAESAANVHEDGFCCAGGWQPQPCGTPGQPPTTGTLTPPAPSLTPVWPSPATLTPPAPSLTPVWPPTATLTPPAPSATPGFLPTPTVSPSPVTATPDFTPTQAVTPPGPVSATPTGSHAPTRGAGPTVVPTVAPAGKVLYLPWALRMPAGAAPGPDADS